MQIKITKLCRIDFGLSGRVLTCFNLAATNLNSSLLTSSLIGKEKEESMLCTMISEESLQGQPLTNY